ALRWSDFMAFEPLAELPIGMSAHVVYEAIDPERPATQSPRVMTLVREELGFGGLMLTDDLSMQALSGTLAQRAVLALEAGCDIALHCNGTRDEMVEVAGASGRLDGQALARAEHALDCRRLQLPIDIEAAEAEFLSLMQGQAGRDV
ncbi:MAG TPA: glycoside hydrolase family 3 protein, partial [Aliiroseovarius sp.]|nr:glycoside hydrolase family 3 protein [Aliiroseovarius sp.]